MFHSSPRKSPGPFQFFCIILLEYTMSPDSKLTSDINFLFNALFIFSFIKLSLAFHEKLRFSCTNSLLVSISSAKYLLSETASMFIFLSNTSYTFCKLLLAPTDHSNAVSRAHLVSSIVFAILSHSRISHFSTCMNKSLSLYSPDLE